MKMMMRSSGRPMLTQDASADVSAIIGGHEREGQMRRGYRAWGMR